jgi:peptidoglycan hydrolase-like protein with peptidoglycan-binding domain
MRRIVVAVAGLAIAAGLVAAGWWAGRETLATPRDPLTSVEPVTYEVVEQTLERTLTFAAVAEWSLSPGVRNTAAGTVTAVDMVPGGTIGQGDVLYAVDLRPVIAAQGTVPSFRDLRLRDEGPDVAQLQQLLTDLGFYGGDIDGTLGTGTRTAVKAWQNSLGIEDDGVVRRGDVLFFPELPRRVVPGETMEVGATLVGGETAVEYVEGDPRFWIPLTTEQRSLVPLSAQVRITHGDDVWEAQIDRVEEHTSEGRLDFVLTSPGGGSVCGADCETVVPLTERTNYPAEIVVIPRTAGPVVPIAALATSPSGEVSVRLAAGGERPVTVLVTTGGLAVVEGVDAGEVLLLPLEEPEQ